MIFNNNIENNSAEILDNNNEDSKEESKEEDKNNSKKDIKIKENVEEIKEEEEREKSLRLYKNDYIKKIIECKTIILNLDVLKETELEYLLNTRDNKKLNNDFRTLFKKNVKVSNGNTELVVECKTEEDLIEIFYDLNALLGNNKRIELSMVRPNIYLTTLFQSDSAKNIFKKINIIKLKDKEESDEIKESDEITTLNISGNLDENDIKYYTEEIFTKKEYIDFYPCRTEIDNYNLNVYIKNIDNSHNNKKYVMYISSDKLEEMLYNFKTEEDDEIYIYRLDKNQFDGIFKDLQNASKYNTIFIFKNSNDLSKVFSITPDFEHEINKYKITESLEKLGERISIKKSDLIFYGKIEPKEKINYCLYGFNSHIYTLYRINPFNIRPIVFNATSNKDLDSEILLINQIIKDSFSKNTSFWKAFQFISTLSYYQFVYEKDLIYPLLFDRKPINPLEISSLHFFTPEISHYAMDLRLQKDLKLSGLLLYRPSNSRNYGFIIDSSCFSFFMSTDLFFNSNKVKNLDYKDRLFYFRDHNSPVIRDTIIIKSNYNIFKPSTIISIFKNSIEKTNLMDSNAQRLNTFDLNKTFFENVTESKLKSTRYFTNFSDTFIPYSNNDEELSGLGLGRMIPSQYTIGKFHTNKKTIFDYRSISLIESIVGSLDDSIEYKTLTLEILFEVFEEQCIFSERNNFFEKHLLLNLFSSKKEKESMLLNSINFAKLSSIVKFKTAQYYLSKDCKNGNLLTYGYNKLGKIGLELKLGLNTVCFLNKIEPLVFLPLIKFKLDYTSTTFGIFNKLKFTMSLFDLEENQDYMGISEITNENINNFNQDMLSHMIYRKNNKDFEFFSKLNYQEVYLSSNENTTIKFLQCISQYKLMQIDFKLKTFNLFLGSDMEVFSNVSFVSFANEAANNNIDLGLHNMVFPVIGYGINLKFSPMNYQIPLPDLQITFSQTYTGTSHWQLGFTINEKSFNKLKQKMCYSIFPQLMKQAEIILKSRKKLNDRRELLKINRRELLKTSKEESISSRK